MGGSYYLSYYYLLYLLIIYLMCRVILELEELQESQVPPVKRYVSSDDKKGISCSDSPHQIVSFIWLEQLNEWNLFLADSECVYKLTIKAGQYEAGI